MVKMKFYLEHKKELIIWEMRAEKLHQLHLSMQVVLHILRTEHMLTIQTYQNEGDVIGEVGVIEEVGVTVDIGVPNYPHLVSFFNQ